MQNMVINKRDIYVASKIIDSNPIQYSTPIKTTINVYPISSEIGLQTIGISYNEYMRGLTNNIEIKEGDGAYINIKPEVDFNILGDNLEYIVTSVVPKINEVEIMFRRKAGV